MPFPPFMNKSTKIDLKRSKFQHIPLSFQTHYSQSLKTGQIQSTSPKPSTTYYTLSSLAFTISFHILAQPDSFPLRQNYSLFPSFFLILITSHCLPSYFSNNTKTFNKILKVVFLSVI